MEFVNSKRVIRAIVTFIAIMMFASMLAIEPVNAKSAAKPAKVKNVKATTYAAQMVRFNDGTVDYIAPAKIKWAKAKKAKYYQVGYKTGLTGWKYINTKSRSLVISSTKSLSSNLLPGVKYSVKVRAWNGKKHGKWSVTKKFTTKKAVYSQPGEIENLKVTEKCAHDYSKSQSPVILKWSKADNAQKYEVAYRSGKNDWNIVTTYNNTIKVEPLKPYCKYDFKVRAINGNIIGTWSDVLQTITRPNSVEIDFPEIRNFRVVKNGLGSVKLDWDADYSAYTKSIIDNKHVTYNVYASTDTAETKNWTLVGDHINATEWIQRGCEIGTTYFFKVVPADNSSYKEFDYEGTASKVVQGKGTANTLVTVVKKYTENNGDFVDNREYNIRGLMLHSVGGNIESAEEWCRLYDNEMAHTASVHGFIDGTTGDLWQTFDWNKRAGHAGPAGNNRYVGIEMCESKYLRYESDDVTFTVEPGHEKDAKDVATRTYKTAVKLFAFLCDYYGMNPAENGVIVSHYEWGTKYSDLSGGGHQDPEHMWRQLKTGYTMDGFRSDVAKLYKKSGNK